LPGIAPLTGALKAFAEFFGIDGDLVAAAAERSAEPELATSPGAARGTIAGMSDQEKTDWLARLFEGDTHVATEFRALVRQRLKPNGASPVAARTVSELRARADAIRGERERALAESAAAERKRQEEEAERSRRARLDGIARRGESVWREIEAEIERRSPVSYDKAAALLLDLRTIAEEKGETEEFALRLRAIRERHAKKERFLERLTKLG
jgi:hypothetical protein